MKLSLSIQTSSMTLGSRSRKTERGTYLGSSHGVIESWFHGVMECQWRSHGVMESWSHEVMDNIKSEEESGRVMECQCRSEGRRLTVATHLPAPVSW